MIIISCDFLMSCLFYANFICHLFFILNNFMHVYLFKLINYLPSLSIVNNPSPSPPRIVYVTDESGPGES